MELTVNYAFSGLNLSRLSSLNGYFYKVFYFLLNIFHGIFFSEIKEGGISGNDEQSLCLLLGRATTAVALAVTEVTSVFSRMLPLFWNAMMLREHFMSIIGL